MRISEKRYWLVAAFIAVTGTYVAAVGKNKATFDYRELDSDHGKVEVFDVDNDGLNDVVKRSSGGESLVWYKYNKVGTFTKHVVLANQNFRGDRTAVADIDKDGDIDLATGLQDTRGYHVVWIENPLPKLDPAKPNSWKVHKVGIQDDYMKDIAIADFNRDQKLDIVTRAHTRTAIYFHKSLSNWARLKVIDHASHEGMDVGDLDRDGDPDIVLNGFWFETPAEAEKETYKKHIFDSKWFTPIDKSWRDNNTAIRVIDVTGDGLLDIIISHSELPGFPISIYTAATARDFQRDQWREIKVTDKFDFCQTLDTGDIDNDGDVDILAAKFERDHQTERWRNQFPYPIVVFYNVTGDGSKWQQKKISDDSMYAGILGDIGSDGDLDIVGPRTYWQGPIKMYENKTSDNKLSLSQFKYIQIDGSRDKRYFGLAFGDFTGDGYQDIVTGKWFYKNPGGDMTGKWERVAVDEDIDALIVVDVDGDRLGDFIGLKPNEQYWFEAKDQQGKEWKKIKIGSLPISDHGISTQYYSVGQIIPGKKPEIVLQQYYLHIPQNPEKGNWPANKYCIDAVGYAIGDIDGDGLADIAGSYRVPGQGKVPGTKNLTWGCSMMAWWKNPGSRSANWKRHDVGKVTHADRYAAADMNGDGRLDIITSEERYPGHVPNGSCYWFEQPSDPKSRNWKRHLVVTQMSMNNLDVADMDRDGDMDIITCEHSMPYGGKPAPDNERLQIWENDGKGNFTLHVIDRGKESHLGAQTADLDGDGDLDIVSIAWRDYQYLHLWRNDNR